MGMYDDIFQVGPVADQQDQVNQLIQEELTRRKQNAVIPQHSTGLGALFEGVGNIIGDHRSRDTEGALRTQRAGLAGRMAGLHSRYADILMGSKPEDLPNAALAGELSGSPSMAKAGTNYAATAADRDPAVRGYYASRAWAVRGQPCSPEHASTPHQGATHQRTYIRSKLTTNRQTRNLSQTQPTGAMRTLPVSTQGLIRFPLNPNTLKMLADLGRTAGPQAVPSFGFGRGAAQAKAQVFNEMASGETTPDLAAAKADYLADSESLKNITKMDDSVQAFKRTAGQNLDVFLNTAKKVIDTGSPLLNKPLRALDDKVLGSPDMAAFRTARQYAMTEFAKVIQNPNLTGVLSDDARKEIAHLAGEDATLPQLYEAAKIIKQDSENRSASNALQKQIIQGRIQRRGDAPGDSTTKRGPLGQDDLDAFAYIRDPKNPPEKIKIVKDALTKKGLLK
jgi:hypothetical protein